MINDINKERFDFAVARERIKGHHNITDERLNKIIKELAEELANGFDC